MVGAPPSCRHCGRHASIHCVHSPRMPPASRRAPRYSVKPGHRHHISRHQNISHSGQGRQARLGPTPRTIVIILGSILAWARTIRTTMETPILRQTRHHTTMNSCRATIRWRIHKRSRRGKRPRQRRCLTSSAPCRPTWKPETLFQTKEPIRNSWASTPKTKPSYRRTTS